MKRVVFVIAILSLAVCAFAVSGKVFMRYGMYNELGDTVGTVKIGPMWSYWGDPYNTDIWQNQPGGTGFSVNFDKFGFRWLTREKFPDVYTTPDSTVYTPLNDLLRFNTGGGNDIVSTSSNGIYTSGIDRWGFAKNNNATSPGYFEINNIMLGNISLMAGFAWWQLHATDTWFGTNVVDGTNVNYNGTVNYDKFYLNFKFNIPIAGDAVVLKIVDWDLLWTEFYFGTATVKGDHNNDYVWWGGPSEPFSWNGNVVSNQNTVSGFKIYVPLRLFVNLDAISLDIGPKLIYDTSSYQRTSMTYTNDFNTAYIKAGIYLRANVGLTEMLSVYADGGYFFENETWFDRNTAGTVVTTNVDDVNVHNIIPIAAGLKIKLAPGVSFNLGYGVQLYLASQDIVYGPGRSSTNIQEYGMILRNGYLQNWSAPGNSYWINGVLTRGFSDTAIGQRPIMAERQTYGDTVYDNSFVRFGGEATFAQSWTLGLAGAVTLNDGWAYNWYNDGSYNMKQYVAGYSYYGYHTVFNWLTFQNMMNFDNNMFIKYEDDKVAIKATLAMFPLTVHETGAPSAGNRDGGIASLFTYIDFTVKF